jgi:hypothetical protein
MTKNDKLLRDMRKNPQNVRFSELLRICEMYFGASRNNGTSHFIFRTPWQGDPRVIIQKGKGGKAKVYQVRQVLAAIDKLEGKING